MQNEKPQSLPCVLACSGCSHAGELADRTARRMQEMGAARMTCLAGVGGRVKSIMATVNAAPERMMIDGCPLECGAHALRLAGITEFQHFKLHEQGIHKHHSEVSTDAIQALAEAASLRLKPIHALAGAG